METPSASPTEDPSASEVASDPKPPELDAIEQAPFEANSVDLIASDVLHRAVAIEASDVHLQCLDRGVMVRFRIDGMLEDQQLLATDVGSRLVNHLKAQARMDVADRRRPQDGRLEYTCLGETVDLRLATMKSLYGENLTIRVLDPRRSFHHLDQIGLEKRERSALERLLKSPQGLILVTGPTGAGKTTTLYSLLDQLNRESKNLVTVEEPIEFDLDRVNQIAVDRKLGLGFAECLAACFRHDPDVIMVGEIRDPESAQIAVRAALSGHLVLSSLHTGSTLGAFSTLTHFGISPFLAAASLVGVVAQQLIRKICPMCRRSMELQPGHRAAFALGDVEADLDGHSEIAVGEGCENCRESGYRGRTGIFEIMEINSPIRDALAARASRRRLEELARNGGWRSLLESGYRRVLSGQTTIEEVLRVVPASHDPEYGHDWTPGEISAR